MANIFVLSDTHFNHHSILTFKRDDGSPLRDFSCIEEHDEYIIDKWNSVVRPQDKVYHLGDVVMNPKKLWMIGRCNGHKRLVLGNHDSAKTKEYLQYFEELYSIRVLDKIAFTHIPIHPECLGRFKANVHGHIHYNQSPSGKYQNGKDVIYQQYMNVSMEALNDYTPVSLEDVKKKLGI